MTTCYKQSILKPPDISPIVRHDTPTFTFTLKHKTSGEAVDLSQIPPPVVTFAAKEYKPKGTTGLKFSRVCTILDGGTTGRVRVKLLSVDTDTSGKYLGEIEIDWGSGTTVVTAAQFQFSIVDDVKSAPY